jgi:hypothetical protein
VGRGVSSSNRTVRVRLVDGTAVRLDITETPFGRRRLEEQASQIRAWATGAGGPHR